MVAPYTEVPRKWVDEGTTLGIFTNSISEDEGVISDVFDGEVFDNEVFDNEVFASEVFNNEVFVSEVFNSQVFASEVFNNEVFDNEVLEIFRCICSLCLVIFLITVILLFNLILG